MNLTNDGGQTPLHIICQNNKSYTYFYTLSDRVGEETFIKITEDLNQPVQVDARDKLGRTPLQWAVANLFPRIVDWLLDHGADLSSFVLLPEDDFTARFDPNEDNSSYFKLGIASGALTILESLEKRGYQVDDYALIIMKIFSRLSLFKKSTYVQTRWYDEEEFASLAKQWNVLPRIEYDEKIWGFELEREMNEIAMTPSMSFYDLILLRPEEAAQILTYRDYSDIDSLTRCRRVPRNYYEDVMLHLYEKVLRGFFRRWALDYFYELIRYRLPILCCEKIIDQLMNEDLCNICFAATGQDPY
ncbi:unnamed protein product [Trichogramma brassicae]|uniref:Uncharacterized protein n=1 Tax=Trichogramma brassicae TaxID=86971 RepID=A0A6H5I0A7_9HYME|nr:unnamed protein product [Trichogramma brassicae]